MSVNRSSAETCAENQNEEVAQIKPIAQTGRLRKKDSIRVSILSMFKGPKDVACVRALIADPRV